MRLVDDAVRDTELHRQAGYPRQIAGIADTLDEDEQVRLARRTGVTAPFRGLRASRSPARRPGRAHPRLVAQVGADDHRIVAVAGDNPFPVGDPARFGEAIVCTRGRSRRRRSTIRRRLLWLSSTDHHAVSGQGSNDPIEDVHGPPPAQVGIGGHDPIGTTGLLSLQLVGPGQPDRV